MLKNFFEKCKSIWCKFTNWVKNLKWKVIYDKFTTGLLILLMASPVIVLTYIILWFVIPR